MLNDTVIDSSWNGKTFVRGTNTHSEWFCVLSERSQLGHSLKKMMTCFLVTDTLGNISIAGFDPKWRHS